MCELNEVVQRIYDEIASFYLNDPGIWGPSDASVQLTLEYSVISRVLRRHDISSGGLRVARRVRAHSNAHV